MGDPSRGEQADKGDPRQRSSSFAQFMRDLESDSDSDDATRLEADRILSPLADIESKRRMSSIMASQEDVKRQARGALDGRDSPILSEASKRVYDGLEEEAKRRKQLEEEMIELSQVCHRIEQELSTTQTEREKLVANLQVAETKIVSKDDEIERLERKLRAAQEDNQELEKRITNPKHTEIVIAEYERTIERAEESRVMEAEAKRKVERKLREVVALHESDMKYCRGVEKNLIYFMERIGRMIHGLELEQRIHEEMVRVKNKDNGSKNRSERGKSKRVDDNEGIPPQEMSSVDAMCNRLLELVEDQVVRTKVAVDSERDVRFQMKRVEKQIDQDRSLRLELEKVNKALTEELDKSNDMLESEVLAKSSLEKKLDMLDQVDDRAKERAQRNDLEGEPLGPQSIIQGSPMSAAELKHSFKSLFGKQTFGREHFTQTHLAGTEKSKAELEVHVKKLQQKLTIAQRRYESEVAYREGLEGSKAVLETELKTLQRQSELDRIKLDTITPNMKLMTSSTRAFEVVDDETPLKNELLLQKTKTFDLESRLLDANQEIHQLQIEIQSISSEKRHLQSQVTRLLHLDTDRNKTVDQSILGESLVTAREENKKLEMACSYLRQEVERMKGTESSATQNHTGELYQDLHEMVASEMDRLKSTMLERAESLQAKGERSHAINQEVEALQADLSSYVFLVGDLRSSVSQVVTLLKRALTALESNPAVDSVEKTADRKSSSHRRHEERETSPLAIEELQREYDEDIRRQRLLLEKKTSAVAEKGPHNVSEIIQEAIKTLATAQARMDSGSPPPSTVADDGEATNINKAKMSEIMKENERLCVELKELQTQRLQESQLIQSEVEASRKLADQLDQLSTDLTQATEENQALKEENERLQSSHLNGEQ